MTEVRQASVALTANEYAELLAKLANELEVYCAGDVAGASPGLKMAFVKMDRACPYQQDEYFQTTLMVKYRQLLAPLYAQAY